MNLFHKYPSKTRFVLGLVLLIFEATTYPAIGDILAVIIEVAGFGLVIKATMDSVKYRKQKKATQEKAPN